MEEFPSLQDLAASITAGLGVNNAPSEISEQINEVLKIVLTDIRDRAKKPGYVQQSTEYFHNVESLLRSVKSIKELYVGKPN